MPNYNRRSIHDSLTRDLPYGFTTPFKLFDIAKDSLSLVQRLSLQRKLAVHSGCVNSICWNERGDYILSGSDDQHLCITHGYNYEISTSLQTGHRANIFSARFLPNTSDNHVISCSGDGIIIFSDIQRPETSFSNTFNCHFGTAYEIMTVPNDSHTFLSCGEDKTVRWFDLRIKNSCSKEDCKEDILINCRCAVTTLAVNPLTPFQLGVGCADSSVRIFDRRMLGTRATGSFTGSGIPAMVSRFTVPEFEGNAHRITSLAYSPDGGEILVSYSSDYIYLFDVNDDRNSVPKVIKGNKMALGQNTSGRSKPSEKPSMKRLRVRGDWSDTGPRARPESEAGGREQSSRSLHTSLLSRMSDVLTRMFASNVNADATSNPQGEVQSVLSESESAIGPNATTNPEVEQVPSSTEVGVESSLHLSNSTLPSESEPIIETPQDSISDIKNTPGGSSSISDNLPEVQTVEESEENTPQEELSEAASVDRSLEKMKKELTTCTKEKGEREPLFSLTFSGHGVQSGVISIDAAGSSGTTLPTIPADDSISSISEDSNKAAIEPARSPSPPKDDSLKKEVVEASFSEASQSSVDLVENAEFAEAAPLDNSLELEVPTISSPREEEESLLWEVDNSTTDDEDETEREPSLREYNLRAMSRGRLSTSSGGTSSSDFSRSPKDGTRSLFHSLKKEPSTSGESPTKERSPSSQMSTVPLPRVKRKYIGHRNARTMIKEATFWGNRFIMSGSDCGHIFIWDRDSTELVMILEADHHVVNCLQPHPFDPILASSGIDYDVKLWAPLKEEPFFDVQRASEIIKRNEIMLEETKDTITVPASFMIRMLASLNHIRSSGGTSVWRRIAREARGDPSNAQ